MRTSDENNEVVKKQRTESKEFVTISDLQKFQSYLITEIAKLLQKGNSYQPVKKWLRSIEVRKLLNISPGTLQNLRMTGTIPFTKVGGAFYYDYDDIQNIFSANKNNAKS